MHSLLPLQKSTIYWDNPRTYTFKMYNHLHVISRCAILTFFLLRKCKKAHFLKGKMCKFVLHSKLKNTLSPLQFINHRLTC